MVASLDRRRSMNWLNRWMREPLLHFLLLGFAAFGLDRWMAAPEVDQPVMDTIQVSPAVRAGVRDEWRRQIGGTPGPEEETRLVEDWIDREVLYRRALELGLDRADPVLRKRLVDQMRMIIEGEVSPGQLSDEDLLECLEATPERYRRPATVTFEQVFFSTALRGADASADAEAILNRLRREADAGEIQGDPFVRGSRFLGHDRTALTRVFGPVFAAAVLEAQKSEWIGPLRSVHGLHLVCISERRDERAAGVDEVRARLEKDCEAHRREVAMRAALDALRDDYTIVRMDGE
jgi:peptidyl-prolyl cis-trans isomerase C